MGGIVVISIRIITIIIAIIIISSLHVTNPLQAYAQHLFRIKCPSTTCFSHKVASAGVLLACHVHLHTWVFLVSSFVYCHVLVKIVIVCVVKIVIVVV